MMKKIIKAITLALFLTLIIGFVAYKVGYFKNQKSTYSIHPNKSVLNNPADTIPKMDSLIYSSKSGIIFSSEDFERPKLDSVATDSLRK